jgi:hypothetical protein
MRDTNWLLDHVSLWAMGSAIVLALLLTALSMGLKRWKGGWWFLDGRRWIDGRLGWAGLGLLILSWVVPRHISGGDLADYRLITTGLMVCVMAIDWCPPWWVLSAPAGLYAVRLATTTLSWQEDLRQTDEILTALNYLPEGAKVASVVLTPREFWWFNKQEHVGGYIVIRRHALVNMNFALPHIHMLHVKEGGPGFADPRTACCSRSTSRCGSTAFVRPIMPTGCSMSAPRCLKRCRITRNWCGRARMCCWPNCPTPASCPIAARSRACPIAAQRKIDAKLKHMPDLKLEGSANPHPPRDDD